MFDDLRKKYTSCIVPLSPNEMKRRGWRIHSIQLVRDANGRVVLRRVPMDDIVQLTIENPSHGTLVYGQTPAGYDSWNFHEAGGGGSVIIPYVLVKEDIFIGVVKEARYNMGGDIWNCPRGGLNSSTESHLAAAQRELAEEVFQCETFDPTTCEVVELPGEPGNPLSTYFATLDPSEGCRYFATSFNEADIVQDGDGYIFREGFIKPNHKFSADQQRVGERISECRFIHWTQGACLKDQFTNVAVARLIAWLSYPRGT